MDTTRSENNMSETQGSEPSLEVSSSNLETPTTARPTQDTRRVTLSSSPSSPRTSTIPRRLLLPIIRSSVSMYNSASPSVPASSSSTSTRMSNENIADLNATTTTSQRTLLSTPTTHRLPLSRSRSRSRDDESNISTPPTSPVMNRGHSSRKASAKARVLEMNSESRSKSAQKENDSMIYLDGPQIYTCNQCRTHFTSHDDIISKSFHGRHGRAYLFDQCVNVNVGPPEDRHLMTGLHSVCDIFCKRCKHLVGWTYAKAYESSQKYKEGKFIIEKINLHMEESDYYEVDFPAGERRDRWRIRSMSWGSDKSLTSPRHGDSDVVFEYKPCNISSSLSPYLPLGRSMDKKVGVKTPPVRNLPPPPSL